MLVLPLLTLQVDKGAAKDARMVILGLLSGVKTAGPVDLGPILFKRMRIEGTVRCRIDTYINKGVERNATDTSLKDGRVPR